MVFETKAKAKLKKSVCIETGNNLIKNKQKTQKIFTFSALENELKFISYDKTDVIDYCSEVEDILNNQEETEVVAIKKKF